MSRNYNIRDQDKPHFLTLTVVKWLSVFNNASYAKIIIESLNYCIENKGMEVYAWCLMKNHLHLIARAKPESKLQDIVRDFKKFTSKRVIAAIYEDSENLDEGKALWVFRQSGIANSNNKYHQFWQQHNHPIELSNNLLFDQKLKYIHQNPVKAGLVNESHDYRLSSAIDYSGGQGLVKIESVN